VNKIFFEGKIEFPELSLNPPLYTRSMFLMYQLLTLGLPRTGQSYETRYLFLLARHAIRPRSFTRNLLTFPLHVARACGRRARVPLRLHARDTLRVSYHSMYVLYDSFDIVERGATRPRARDRYAGNNPRLLIARQTLTIPRKRPSCMLITRITLR